MKHVTCADLIPHCPAEFTGPSDMDIVEQYAPHARQEHGTPIPLLDLLDAITAAA